MPSRSLTKTFFFWIGIGFISFIFLKLVLTNKNPAAGLAYSEFQKLVDNNDILSVNIYLEPTSAKVYALLRGTQKYVETTIPSAELPDLTRLLRERHPRRESVTTCTGLKGAGNLLLAGSSCRSTRGLWDIRMEMCWRMLFAMRCWGRRGLVTSERIFRTRIRNGRARTV